MFDCGREMRRASQPRKEGSFDRGYYLRCMRKMTRIAEGVFVRRCIWMAHAAHPWGELYAATLAVLVSPGSGRTGKAEMNPKVG